MTITSAFNNHRLNSVSKSQNHYKRNDFDSSYRDKLSNILFGKSIKKNISFGWSKNVEKNSVEAKILDELTNPFIKTAITASCIRPGADAYGSSIGVAGILAGLGVKVCTVINDYPNYQYFKMPSIYPDKTAPQYIERPYNMDKYKDKFDIAVITDCVFPDSYKINKKGFKDETLELVSQSKKVIIIDHHPDSPRSSVNPNGDTNEQLWRKALEGKVAPENILYWRDTRAPSTSEMVAKLDEEIAKQTKYENQGFKCDITYPIYRLALAAGIFEDAGGYHSIDTRFRLQRYSSNIIENDKHKFESSTNYYLKWLLNNSGIEKSEINLFEYTQLPLPETVKNEFNDILKGKIKNDSIEIKNPTIYDPIGYVYIKDDKYFREIANSLNESGEYGFKFPPTLIANYFKRFAKTMDTNPNLGVLLVVTSIIDDNKNKFTLKMRSFKNKNIKYVSNTISHVNINDLASKILKRLIDKGIGYGGGYNNFNGFKSNANMDFKEDACPIIKNVVDEELNGKNLTDIPDNK